MNQAWQKFLGALPASGMMPHSEFLIQLEKNGHRNVYGEIHPMRRAGLIKVENREVDGKQVPYVGKAVNDASE